MTTRALRRIDTLTTQLNALSAERELAISRALAAGATWVEIAHWLGTSPRRHTGVTVGSATATRPAPSGTNARYRSEGQPSVHLGASQRSTDHAY